MDQTEKGRCKIFLGYAAGVGKTYSMLEAARQKKKDGKDVVIGVVVTHGRKDTEKLLEGMEIIPSSTISYKGVDLPELDLDAVLKRRPQIVIIDELAHTNVPGSRHTKRYMDVEELLQAGIDVYTTLNIQHLESFQDPIEQATGVFIRERVPDTILDEADEIELIDLPPEDLLERLRQGKVYVPDRAARAMHKFFKRDNLQLLREISLRKTASIVDTDRTKLRFENGASQVAPRLLASIGPSPFSEYVIRATKRLADMLHAEWTVASVSMPDAEYHSEEQQKQLYKNFHLAEELGATIITLPGESIADTIFQYAKTHGITQIVLGHSQRPWYSRFFGLSPVDALVKKEGALDIYIISSKADTVSSAPAESVRSGKIDFWKFARYITTPVLYVLFFSLLLLPFLDYLHPLSLSISYLMFSVVAAFFLPFTSFILYMFLSLFMFDALFLPELGIWAFEKDSVVFFIASFVIGLFVNQLSVRQRRLSKTAVLRHQETLQLFELARDLASVQTPQMMLKKLNGHLKGLMNCRAIIYVKIKGKYEKIGTTSFPFDSTDQMAAVFSIEHKQIAGKGTNTLPSAQGVYFPLIVTGKCSGSMGVYPLDDSVKVLTQKSLLETCAHLLALSLDRSENIST